MLKLNTQGLGLLLGCTTALAISACSGDDMNNNNNNNEGPCKDVPGFNPDLSAVVENGGCCEFTNNCVIGSICNTDLDPLFDADKTLNICIQVVCANDADCDAPETCAPDKVCRVPSCQNDAQCPQGESCQSGSCAPPPGTDQVASCEVVSKDATIRQGQTLELAAVARNANGKALASIPFDWTSSDTAAVSVAGNVVTGGASQATATLTASPMGRTDLTCDRSADITNFPNVAVGDIRVVVVADSNGAPVNGATVIIDAGGPNMATTDASGAATVTAAGNPTSVTVSAAGFQLLTVVEPGTNDLFIPLPVEADDSMAGGFRGVVDISATADQDIKLGLVGPSIPNNLLDFDLTSLLGDFIPTTINAQDLGLNDTFDLPGGLVFGLGSQEFTADNTRCGSITSGEGELGCFVTRAPAGPVAGWGLAGQVKLTDVTGLVDEISAAIDGGGDDLPIGSLLTSVLPLLSSLNHAINPSLVIEEFPTSNGEADISKYQRADMAADAELSIKSRLSVPTLPNVPGGATCANGLIVLSGAALEGRGIVPLGISAGVDAADDTQTPDCTIAGIEDAFGKNTEDLNDGVMPLSMAPPHSGIEGSQLFLLAVALDIDALTGDNGPGLQLGALIQRVDAVGEDQSITGSFPAYPEATINAAGSAVNFTSSLAGQTLVRVELQNGNQTWLVYAPANATVTLPNVTAGQAILGALTDSFVLSMGTSGSYADVWSFGSGRTLDRLVDTVTSFAIQECAATGSPCVIQ